MTVERSAGCVGTAECGLLFTVRLPEPLTSATLSYKVKFEANYDFTRGGKLPGLCDEACPTACDAKAADGGWSGRVHWREGGWMTSYMYLPGGTLSCYATVFHFDSHKPRTSKKKSGKKINFASTRELIELQGNAITAIYMHPEICLIVKDVRRKA
jgi:hypothetical protein